MKKLTRLFLLMTLVVLLAFSAGCVISPSQDADGFVFRSTGSGYALVDFNGKEPDLTIEIEIPSHYKGKPVTSISKGALAEYSESTLASRYDANFADKDKDPVWTRVTRIVIPDTVTEIGDYAFDGCSKLVEIILPHTLKSIGKGAFNNCSNLESIKVKYADGTLSTENEFPVSVVDVPDGMFNKCAKLKSIKLSKDTQVIGKLAFAQCNALNSVKLGDFVLAGIDNDLTASSANAKLTLIDSYAFQKAFTDYANKAAQVNVNIPDSVKTTAYSYGLGVSAFEGATGLSGVRISSGLTKLANAVFKGCVSLDEESLVIDSVEVIGESVFEGCTSLKEVKLNEKIREIPNNAFKGCTGLEIVDLDATMANGQKLNVMKIGNGAFSGCTGITQFKFSENTYWVGSNAVAGCINLRSVYVADTITYMSSGVFDGCTNLVVYCNNVNGDRKAHPVYDANWQPIAGQTETLSRASTWIGAVADSITGIKATDVKEEGGAQYVKITNNGVESYKLVRYVAVPQDPTDELNFEFVASIDGLNVTEINKAAFKGCDNLTTVTIRGNVTVIPEGAFAFNNSLKTVYINPNTSITRIVDSAFENCPVLESIEIEGQTGVLPTTFQEIGSKAFKGCTVFGVKGESAYTLALPSVTTLGESVFEGCEGLTSVVLSSFAGGANKTIPASLFSGCSSLDSVTFKSGADIKVIGASAFKNTALDNDFQMWDSVEEIGKNAFENCVNFTEFTIGESVAIINDQAFKGCTGITRFNVDSKNSNYVSDENGVIYSSTTKTISFRVSKTKSALTASSQKYNWSYTVYEDLMCYPLASAATSYEVKIPGTSNSNYTIENIFTAMKNYTGVNRTEIRNAKYIKIFAADNASFANDSVVYERGKADNAETPVEGTDPVVKRIASYAFEGAVNIEKVIIPQNVRIGKGAFDGCVNISSFEIKTPEDDSSAELNIKRIDVDSNEVVYSMIKNNVVTADKTVLIAFPRAKTVSELRLPDSVFAIEEGALANASIGTLYLGKNFGASSVANSGFRVGSIDGAKIGSVGIDYKTVFGRYTDTDDVDPLTQAPKIKTMIFVVPLDAAKITEYKTSIAELDAEGKIKLNEDGTPIYKDVTYLFEEMVVVNNAVENYCVEDGVLYTYTFKAPDGDKLVNDGWGYSKTATVYAPEIDL